MKEEFWEEIGKSRVFGLPSEVRHSWTPSDACMVPVVCYLLSGYSGVFHADSFRSKDNLVKSERGKKKKI